AGAFEDAVAEFIIWSLLILTILIPLISFERIDFFKKHGLTVQQKILARGDIISAEEEIADSVFVQYVKVPPVSGIPLAADGTFPAAVTPAATAPAAATPSNSTALTITPASQFFLPPIPLSLGQHPPARFIAIANLLNSLRLRIERKTHFEKQTPVVLLETFLALHLPKNGPFLQNPIFTHSLHLGASNIAYFHYGAVVLDKILQR
ncbi:serine/threonine-protein kinase RIO1, partial [Striga asiatica]